MNMISIQSDNEGVDSNSETNDKYGAELQKEREAATTTRVMDTLCTWLAPGTEPAPVWRLSQ